MLRNSINKPKVLYSDDPTLDYGFLNLINIFEKLTPDLYDWVAIGGDEAFTAGSVANNIQQNLAKPVPIEGMMQIQQVDILVTQQWLQAMMWKLSMSNSPHPTDTDTLLPFHLPVLVGKALMDVVGSVSQSAIDAHGIGMVSLYISLSFILKSNSFQEQKLYDMGLSIADMTRNMRGNTTNRLTNTVGDPKELLWGILNILSRIRGSPSYLFPSLLERSSSVFGLESPATMANTMSGYTTDETSPTTATAPAAWNANNMGDGSSISSLDRSSISTNSSGHHHHHHHHNRRLTNNEEQHNSNYNNNGTFRRVSSASHVSHSSSIPPPLVDSLYIA